MRGKFGTFVKSVVLLVAFLTVLFLYTFCKSLSERNAFLEIQNLPVNDPRVLDYLRQLIIPPSTLPYVFTNRSKKYPSEFLRQLDKLFKNKNNGFFIECGANDGEFFSNTLELEKKGWTGLLIEAHPELAKSLLTKHRKAWFANICLSPYNNISEMQFAEANSDWGLDGIGKLLLPDTNNMTHHRLYGTVRCFPLASLMAAMDIKHVDYFSLDVEGVDLKVLKTLPFDDTLVIDYIQVEIVLVKEGQQEVTKFLKSKNYTFLFKRDFDLFYKRNS
ncbi:unnamed protein product [Allacma fusca]|uniref:Methyltransferase FkbM domain-containing protein n=1 Tax=Allacma fusca TaxID=39272 RepID=A0A8J2J828_9HEXA|nr:unnamed protein product [Allacma fusca]